MANWLEKDEWKWWREWMSLRVESSAMVARKSRFLGRRRLERSDYFESHTSFTNVRRVSFSSLLLEIRLFPGAMFLQPKRRKKEKEEEKKVK